MSLINNFIAGNQTGNPTDWMVEMQRGSLSDIVSEVENGGKKCYRIDLQNCPTSNLSAVASLIENLYTNGVSEFELKRFNCDQAAWEPLIKRISQKAKESNPCNLNITVDSVAKQTAISNLTDEYEDSLEGKIHFRILQTSENVEQPVAQVQHSQAKEPIPVTPYQDSNETPATLSQLLIYINNQSIAMNEGNSNRANNPPLSHNNQINVKKRSFEQVPKIEESAELSFQPSLNQFGQRVSLCTLSPRPILFEKPELLNDIVETLKSKKTSFLLVSNVDTVPETAKISAFMMRLLNEPMFTVVGFSNIKMSQRDFEEIAQHTYPHLLSIDFQCEVDGNEWTNSIPILLNNCKNIMTFSCNSPTFVTSFEFLDLIINSADSLTQIDLEELLFEPSLLTAWLMQERDFKKMTRTEELIITLTIPHENVSAEEKDVLKELLDYFHRGSEEIVKIDVIFI